MIFNFPMALRGDMYDNGFVVYAWMKLWDIKQIKQFYKQLNPSTKWALTINFHKLKTRRNDSHVLLRLATWQHSWDINGIVIWIPTELSCFQSSLQYFDFFFFFLEYQSIIGIYATADGKTDRFVAN